MKLGYKWDTALLISSDNHFNPEALDYVARLNKTLFVLFEFSMNMVISKHSNSLVINGDPRCLPRLGA